MESVISLYLSDRNAILTQADNNLRRFVRAVSKQTSQTICLTSYKSLRGNDDLLNSVKIWEACRATAAASSFFDPIAIGGYGEEFVGGATGANNPVVELWNQAQLMWGPESLEGKVQCLVSVGTGIPLLKTFRDDVLISPRRYLPSLPKTSRRLRGSDETSHTWTAVAGIPASMWSTGKKTLGLKIRRR